MNDISSGVQVGRGSITDVDTGAIRELLNPEGASEGMARAIEAIDVLCDEVDRQASLLRAINDSRLDPARAILQADKIAGEAMIRAHLAEAALDRVRALIRSDPHAQPGETQYVQPDAIRRAIAGDDPKETRG
jgi:hypothetical protein